MAMVEEYPLTLTFPTDSEGYKRLKEMSSEKNLTLKQIVDNAIMSYWMLMVWENDGKKIEVVTPATAESRSEVTFP